MMKRELQILGASILYFSRLPFPFKVPYNKAHQQLVLTWFPLVGAIVGSLGALVFYGFLFVLPQPLAIVLSLSAMVLLTGAFHEDGFADVCDAFGGGYTKEQVLIIMKDSRVGAYAAIGLILLFGAKITAMAEIKPETLFLVIIAAQALSRWPLLLITKIWKYARKSNDSKSVDTNKPLSFIRIFFAFILAIFPLIFFCSWYIFFTIPLLVIASLLFGVWFHKKINGYTGDCLGAVQQVNELIFILFCLVLQNTGALIL